MAWFRMHEGAYADAKWPLIARRAKVKYPVVLGVWWALLDHASRSTPRGSIADFDCETIDALYGMPDGTCERVVAVMAEKGLITEGRLANWEKRQPEREDLTAQGRKERYKERKAAEAERTRTQAERSGTEPERSGTEPERAGTHGNASGTQKNAPDTDSDTDLKEKLNTPPFPPQGGSEGAEAREPEILPTPDSPGKGPADEPGIEFHELREAWNAAMRPEGPLAGFPEYKALKKARDGTGMSCWPGIGMILDSAEKRKSLGAWNPGYEPGLAKFLKERTWEAPLPRPRASPQSTTRPAGKSLTRKNLETAALVLAEMDREDAENARRQGA